jgi:hypothetical protein
VIGGNSGVVGGAGVGLEGGDGGRIIGSRLRRRRLNAPTISAEVCLDQSQLLDTPGGGDSDSLGIGDETDEGDLKEGGDGVKGFPQEDLRRKPMVINEVIQLPLKVGNAN